MGNDSQQKQYVAPKVEALGTPAEICQVSKSLPSADTYGQSNPQPYPGETGGS